LTRASRHPGTHIHRIFERKLIMTNSIREGILDEISQERDRQLAKWGEQRHPDDTGGGFLAAAAHNARNTCQQAAKFVRGGPGWRLILAEEVAEAFAESDRVKLRDELVQVAAVAVAWIEDIQSRAVAVPDDDPVWIGCPEDCSGCVCAALGHRAPCSHCSDNHVDPDAKKVAR
jgi:hypothetical protein